LLMLLLEKQIEKKVPLSIERLNKEFNLRFERLSSKSESTKVEALVE
jgi:hypothetical protein